MSHMYVELKNVIFEYEKNVKILDDISFRANERDSIGLIGANGAGKSTLLKLLVGLEENYKGSIYISEMPVIKELYPKIREKIGYVFQDSENQLFMNTVYEDIAFAPRNYGFPESEVNLCVQKAIDKVGINHIKNKPTYKLSGGEKKLAAIATILAMTPDIILMDEPTIALDPKNRRNVINILNSFNHLKIIATHDLDMVIDTCNRVILLANGKIIKCGSTKDILYDKELLENNGLELPLSVR